MSYRNQYACILRATPAYQYVRPPDLLEGQTIAVMIHKTCETPTIFFIKKIIASNLGLQYITSGCKISRAWLLACHSFKII